MKNITVLLFGLFIAIKAYADPGAVELAFDEYMKANYLTKYTKAGFKLDQAAARKNVISLIILGELDSATKIGQVDFEKQAFGYKDATYIDYEAGVVKFLEVALFEITELFLRKDKDFDWYKGILKKAQDIAAAGNESEAEHIKCTVDIMQYSLEESRLKIKKEAQYDEIKAMFEKILGKEESNYFRGKIGDKTNSTWTYLSRNSDFYRTCEILFQKYGDANWKTDGVITLDGNFIISEHSNIDYFKNYMNCYYDFFNRHRVESNLILRDKMTADNLSNIFNFYEKFIDLKGVFIEATSDGGKFPINILDKLVDITKDFDSIENLGVEANNKEQLKQLMQYASSLPKIDNLHLDISKDNSDKELDVRLPQVSERITITKTVTKPLKIQAKEGSSIEYVGIYCVDEILDDAIHRQNIVDAKRLAFDVLKAKKFGYKFNFNMNRLKSSSNSFLGLDTSPQLLLEAIKKTQEGAAQLEIDEEQILSDALAKKLIDRNIKRTKTYRGADIYKLDDLSISITIYNKSSIFYRKEFAPHRKFSPYRGVYISFSKDSE